MAKDTLEQELARQTRAGELVEQLADGAVRCVACGHRCVVRSGKRGVCMVRFNEGGTLKVPHGYVGALQCDPIEKKPFFHVLPGTDALSFGMLGCDFHCTYCQNWVTSQVLRDSASNVHPKPITAEQLIACARQSHAATMASTYNEPLITSEWAVAVFQQAKAAGLKTAYVSNGNATEEVLQYLRPWVDCYKVDLKGFNPKYYRTELGGQLDVVKWSIQRIHEMGFWLEIVTLVIPGFNDSDQELTQIAEFLAGVNPDIPWHVTAFHQDYKMRDPDKTSAATLMRAAEIGERAGLHYVYAGNIPGQVGHYEDTCCPGCQTTLIQRQGFRIQAYRLIDGTCPGCHTTIPGIWS
jgi:pyruvate formate lyase activating enzyme